MADETAKNTKRRVKNPETFRERAVKASEASEKPGKRSRVKRAARAVVTPVTRPLGTASRQLGKNKAFRVVSKPFKLVGKVLLPVYIRNSWKELRLVTWPTVKQSRRLTFAVIIFATVISGAIAFLDYGLDKLFRNILLK
jgi:preprotein translocase subunit SecE